MKKKSYITLSNDEKRIALNHFINSDEYPPLKLSDVTRQIGYKSNESLRSFFPDECRLISARYKAYKSKEKAEQVKKIKQEISECAFTAFKDGEALNETYIMSKVEIGRQFIDPKIREHIKEVIKGSLKDFH